MPSYKLHYFNIRARAEVARFIFAYADMKYEDIRYENEQWAEFKPKTPFGQMPVLEVDGEMICQSQAINRLLAIRAGLMGKDDFENAKIDMLSGCMEDMLKPMIGIFKESDEKKKAELKKKYEEDLPGEVKKLETFVAGNFCVGDKMSLADLEVALGLEWPSFMGITINFKDFPKLEGVREKVFKHPKIAAWIASRPESSM